MFFHSVNKQRQHVRLLLSLGPVDDRSRPTRRRMPTTAVYTLPCSGDSDYHHGPSLFSSLHHSPNNKNHLTAAASFKAKQEILLPIVMKAICFRVVCVGGERRKGGSKREKERKIEYIFLFIHSLYGFMSSGYCVPSTVFAKH